MLNPDVYIGMDVHKTSITVAFADAGRDGEIRRYGEIANAPDAVAKLVKKIACGIGWRNMSTKQDHAATCCSAN